MKRIAIDLDEVLCKTVSVAIDYVLEKTNIKLTLYDFNNYVIEDNKWTDDLKINSRINNCIKNALYNKYVLARATPYSGAVELLSWLKREGHSIYIITGREPEFLNSTVRWLKKYNFQFDNVICTGFGNKNTYSKGLNLSYFIDDFHENLQGIREINACPQRGMVLVNRPWNINACLEAPFARVDNCEDIKEYIKATV